MAQAPPRPGRPKDPTLALRRRDQILRAATRLFARRGYAGTDLQDVADALRVGKGTLYRYFPTKRALFQAAVDRSVTGLHEAVQQAIVGIEDPLEQIGAATRGYLRYFQSSPEYVELFILERAEFRDRRKASYFRHREANVGRWHDLYRGLIERGRIRPIEPERIAEVLGDLIYGTMLTNHIAGRKRDPGEQAAAILDLVFNGLLAPTGELRRSPAEGVGS